MMTLDTIMSTDLITITPDENLAAARTLMHDNKIHHLPVVDSKRNLVGLVTLTNVLAATDSFLRDEDNRIRANDIVVKDIMVTDVATVDENASLRQAALFLEKHRIGCLPVMGGGELKGIITDTDFVAVAINLLEQIEDEESEPYDDEDDNSDDFDELDEVV
jgi:CBS domain-containing protein